MLDISSLPPQNLEAEEMVLGAVLLDGSCFKRVSGILTPDDFYKRSNGVVFAHMLQLQREGMHIDVVTVLDSMNKSGDADVVGGLSALSRMANSVATTAHIRSHAEIILEASRKRRLIAICRNTLSDIGQKSFEESLASMSSAIRTVSVYDDIDIVSMKSVVSSAVGAIENRFKSKVAVSGLCSGVSDLDEFIDGFQPGDNIVVGGRPGMGKTAFAMQCARMAGVPVGVISAEMGEGQLGMRAIAHESGVNLRLVRKGYLDRSQLTSIARAASSLAATDIHVAFQARTDRKVLQAATQMKDRYDIKLLIVDYLQLIRGASRYDRKTDEVSDVSWMMKDIAKTLNIPVITLSQLNRGLEHRDNKRPTLADLRDSGSIEQDADLVIFLYRQDPSLEQGPMEFIIAKGRMTGTGTVHAYWHGPTQSFKNISESEA